MAYDDFEDKSFKVDENYFKVVIPDLDPGKTVPIQLRWQYADKSYSGWSASYTLDVPLRDRPKPTDIVATWVGTDLKITWNASELATGFVVFLTGDSGIGVGPQTGEFFKNAVTSQTGYEIVISEREIRDVFNNVFVTTFTSSTIIANYLDYQTDPQSFTVPAFTDGLTGSAISDASWSITSVDDGSIVGWDKIDSSLYYETEVWKSDTQNGTYIGAGGGTNTTVKVSHISNVWIKIRHKTKRNTYTQYSNAKEASRYDPIFEDVIPPNDVTINSVTWSGDDIVINYTMPATNPPTRFKIVLVNGSATGYFYDYPPLSTGTHTLTIKDASIYEQLGARYNSYTGTFISIDGVENPTAGVPFTVSSKPNPLTGVTPSFVLTAISNGYVADFSNVASGVAYIEVYAKSSSFGAVDPTSQYLVYSGANPGFVIDTDYNPKYIKARYYTLSGQPSNWSAEQVVTPADPGSLSLIDNPVKIATDGSIFTGNLDGNGQPIQSGSRVFFNRTGIYVYDAETVSPTTQIVGDASTLAPTFITTRAKIADWIIYPDRFENGLTATVGTYTGIAPSGSYAIWAGGNSSKNSDGLANFSVTHGGQVVAKKITINGDGTGGTLISAGGVFSVTQAGVLTAQSADIKGTIEATTGVFSGKVLIGSAGKPNGYLAVESGSGFLEVGYGLTKSNNPYYGIQAGSISGGVRTNKFEVSALTGAMFASSGTIGGWTIDTTQLNAGTGSTYVGLATSGTHAIWAGSATASSAPFRVTAGGALTASNAEITGNLKATSGYFGGDTTGWIVTATGIRSALNTDGTLGVIGGKTAKVSLNGTTGVVSGATLSGGVVIGTGFYIGSDTSATDKILSNGELSLAGGLISYTGGILQINPNRLSNSSFKIKLNVTSNEDGTFGDSTLVQAEDGEMTIGRAFFYGGLTDPRVGYLGGAVTARWQVDNGNQGSLGFNKGDIWFQRVS